MSYRITKRQQERLAKMRAAKERKRLTGECPEYPPDLPQLRRRIVIIDYDHGRSVHRLDLYRSDRIDCYDVSVDGQPWKQRIGWSRVLEGLRKSLPRVLSPRSL
ncbi:MAG: hypothetical protein M3H12_18685 [Chromatiales bacterium]|nr:hypothetical protein [Gammaproteobacteria bacterium]